MSHIADVYDKQVRKSIDNFGRAVAILYGSTSNCSSCAFDPVNKTGSNSFCDTCNGAFFFTTTNTVNIKGAVRTFTGDMKSIDASLNRFGFVPEHDARITVMLDDVLYDIDSATGSSYLDKERTIRVEIDAKKYNVKATFRTGADNLKVIIATLTEIQ